MPADRRSPVAVPEQRAAAAAAEIQHAVRQAPARGTRAACRCGLFDPRNGGETRSCRASACSASSRYFVCSCERDMRPEIQIGRRAAADTDVRTRHRRARRRCRAARPGNPGTARARAGGRNHGASSRKSRSSRSARRSQVNSTTSARACEASCAASAGSSFSRRIAAASAAGLPGAARNALRPSCSTSRMDGRSLATIGLAGGHVFEQFQRRREAGRDGGCRIGQHEHVRFLQLRGHLRRRQCSGERHARRAVDTDREIAESLQVRFRFVSADDERLRVLQGCHRFDDEVDPFPWVQMARIADGVAVRLTVRVR